VVLSRCRHVTAIVCAGFATLAVSLPAQGAVERTQGSASVSAQGKSQYTIPLQLPPGVNGLTPSLSLSYSQDIDNGLLGIGFAIGGLSEISRCSKSIALDGVASAATLTINDAYCLGGNRLRLTSGAYGQTSSTYQTAIETFARATVTGSNANGPTSWEVRKKDGLIYEYGVTEDSRIEVTGSVAARAWALNKISDRSGNVIEFVYEESGSYRPLDIRYGRNVNAGTSHTTRVVFVYEPTTRPDPIYSFGSGAPGNSVPGPVNEFKRLDRIDVVDIASSATVRAYEVTYETAGGAGGRSRLSRIQESRGSDMLLPTTITWTSGTPGWASTETATSIAITGGGFFDADINGDGRIDIVFSSSATSGGGTWQYALATETGFAPVTNTGITNHNHSLAQLIEWNGDDKKDLLVPCNGTNTWCVLVATGSGFAAPVNTGASSSGAAASQLVVDLNCDGRDDLARIDTSQLPNRIFTRMRSGTAFAAETLAWTSSFGPFKLGDFSPTFDISKRFGRKKLDFNADGCADFVATIRDDDPEPGTPTLNYIVPFLGTPNGVQETQWLGAGQTTPIYVVAAGDFNGDGYTDIVRSQGTSSFLAFMGNGTGVMTSVQGPPMPNFGYLQLYVADYDGDGMDDIAMPEVSTRLWHVSRSNGNGFGALTSMGYIDETTNHPVDLNGDGGMDMIGVHSAFGSVIRYRMRNNPFPDFADRITDGFDMYVDFDYVRLTNALGVYTPGTGAVYPVREYNGAMFVTSKMTTTTGTGSTYDVTYKYEAARMHDQGLGFLGFAKRTQTDSRNGVITEESYLQDASRYEVMGAPNALRVKQSDGTFMAETTFTWNLLTTGTQRRFPYIASQIEKRYEVGGALNGSLVGTTTTTTDGIDTTSGLIYDSKATVDEASSANGAQPGASYVRRTYHPLAMLSSDAGPSWCIGRPSETQEIRSHNQYGGAAVTRTVGRTWDLAKCRMTQQVVEPGNPTREVTSDIGYDTFGNVNQTTVTGRNPDGTAMTARTTGANWGANGRFLRTITNALSQQTTYGWDEALGIRTSVTDPNQLTTSWVLDNFGRTTRENRPDGTATTISYNDCASQGCLDGNNKQLLIQTEFDTVGAAIRDAWTYLDRYNRPLATRSTLLTGAYSRVERRYDSLGRVTQESAPCAWESCAFFWTVYTYDTAGRLKQVSRPASEIDPNPINADTYYEGLTTRSLDAQGKQTTSVATVIGQPSRNIDHDNYYVQLDYDAFGNPVRISDSALSVFETGTFDVRGFRVDSGTLGAGARTYTYDSLGELISEVDSKLQATIYGYDPLGRMTSRTDAQGTATWTWGASPAAKNIGRLESKSAATGVGESYLYDGFGRLSQTTVALGTDGSHVMNYAYNAMGTLDTLTYPTSTSSYRLRLKYEYAFGQLVRIRDANAPTTVFWAANAANLRGQITQETLGNGLVTSRNFDAVTSYPGFIRTGSGGGSTIQNLSYLWDATGNLTQRQDSNQGLTESFYYDNLYRLDYSLLNSTTNLDVGYDAVGRITSKQDASDTTPEGGTATWFANDLPNTLTGASSQGNGSSQFYYDADGSRYKQVASQVSTNETTVYVGGLIERVTSGTTTKFRHYIQTPSGTAAIYVRSSAGANTLYYTLRDHLGSYDKITSSAGAMTLSLSYSAYGQRRGSDWTGAPSPAEMTTLAGITHRGFTGHEHLDNIGLIHMNGRVFQPSIGRFLSSDPFIDWMQGTQAFNRYAYVGNSPLSGVDPSGFTEEVVVTGSRGGGYSPFPGWQQFVGGSRGVRGPSGFRNTIVRHRELPAPVATDVIAEVVVEAQYDDPVGFNALTEDAIRRLREFLAQQRSDLLEGATAASRKDAKTPPPCETGPSTASGALSFGIYSGPGGEGVAGLHDGRVFGSARAGFGLGGGPKYNPNGGLTVTPSANAPGGTLLSVTGKLGFALGIPSTSLGLSWTMEAGVAYDSNDGFSVVKKFPAMPTFGWPAEKLANATANFGAQVSMYSDRTTVYTSSGTCRAHY
jgi:RHS repeat-associated protein